MIATFKILQSLWLPTLIAYPHCLPSYYYHATFTFACGFLDPYTTIVIPLVNNISTIAPKIDTSCSSTSGSGQNLRNARSSTQRGRYEQLKVARGRIQAAKQAKEAKKACSTRQAHTARQAPTVWSKSDSDTTLSSRATVTAEKHARKPKRGCQRSSFIWQHMTEKEVNGRRKTICKYCGANWFLDGSTSNARRHLKSKHLDKLTGCDALSSRATVTAEKHARKPMLRCSTRQAH